MNRSNDGDTLVVVEGVLKYQTTKAALILQGNGKQSAEYWFPNSQMQKPSVLVDEENHEWAIFVPKWLMKDKPNCPYNEYDESDWPVHTCDKETGEIPATAGELGTLDDFDDDIPF